MKTLYYQETGNKKGPLLVFLHGGGVSGWMWDKQVDYFTDYHCIVPDLPEHGGHQSNMEFSIKNSANESIQLIEEKAGEKQVILVGFSLGSQITIQLLSTKPQLVDYAIINSALVRPMSFTKTMIGPTMRLSYPLIKNKRFSELQAKSLYVSDDQLDVYYEETTQTKPDTLIRILKENMSFTIPKNFNKVKTKMLVTIGEKEKGSMKKSARDIVRANPNCTGITIPKVGHGVPLAMPEFFNQLIEGWVQKGKLPKECRIIE